MVRRVEALLLAVQESHPRATTLRHRVRKPLDSLKIIRRAAGPVRDLDVQRSLIETITRRQGHANSEEERQKLVADCGELDRYLRRRRKQFAKDLASTAREFEPKLEEALENAAGQLKRLDEIPFLAIARGFVTQGSMDLKASKPEDLNEIKPGGLHRFRKQIKVARYLAEMDKTSAPAKRLAQRLKNILDSIGLWHDWMLLGHKAKSAFGKQSLLATAIRNERSHAWTLAVRSVENLRKSLSEIE